MKAQQAIAVVKEITAIAPRLVKGLQGRTEEREIYARLTRFSLV